MLLAYFDEAFEPYFAQIAYGWVPRSFKVMENNGRSDIQYMFLGSIILNDVEDPVSHLDMKAEAVRAQF